MTNRENEKAFRERRIFTAFVAAAGLEIDAGSVSSESPPKPDISCTILGHRHAFELTEITDDDLARNVSVNQKTGVTNGGPYSDDEPLLKTLSAKANRNYCAGVGTELELLAYYDKQRPPHLGLDPSTKTELALLFRKMLLFGAWSRIWLYDLNDGKILLEYRRE